VLAIFDCCDAGKLCANRSPSRWEYLGACCQDALTKNPGPESFTRALIWALKELKAKTFFPTSELLLKIRKAPRFPKDQQPWLQNREVASVDYIVLAPTPSPSASPSDPSSFDLSVRAPACHYLLDLQFQFQEDIDEAIIRETAGTLHKLIKNKKLKAKRIKYLKKHSVPYPGMDRIVHLQMLRRKFGKKWLRLTKKSKPGEKANKQQKKKLGGRPSPSQPLTPQTRPSSDHQESEDELSFDLTQSGPKASDRPLTPLDNFVSSPSRPHEQRRSSTRKRKKEDHVNGELLQPEQKRKR
jgi:hypothetical protein